MLFILYIESPPALVSLPHPHEGPEAGSDRERFAPGQAGERAN